MEDYPKFFGLATVGAKGQIVIPSEARKTLNIKSGDKLIIISGPANHSKMVSLVPVDDFTKFLNKFEEHIFTVKKELSKKSYQKR
jgi:AbrB family looped-hinge helix DNA binding protein